MKTDFDLALINGDILEVYMISESESSSLNLTWNVVSFEGKEMVISLNFTNS